MNKNDIFSDDVVRHGSYAYTTENLSGKLSNARISQAVLARNLFFGKKVVDVGCGDGVYSIELAQSGAKTVLGIDLAKNAIEVAAKNYANISNLRFEMRSVYDVNDDHKCDVAVLRGVLHHVPNLELAIETVCKIAKTIVVVEPNGYNPILKIIEKISPYHRAHDERSFYPHHLRKLFTKFGGEVTFEEYIGLVPFFCPRWIARLCKFFEPLIERLPIIRNLCCGQYIFVVEMR